jgi:hypothetical protein
LTRASGRTLLSVLLGLILLALSARADAYDGVASNLGVGLGVGAPAGLTLELALGRDAQDSERVFWIGGYGGVRFWF